MEALSSEISTVEIVWLAEYMEILGRVAKAYDFCRSIGVGFVGIRVVFCEELGCLNIAPYLLRGRKFGVRLGKSICVFTQFK